MPRRDNVWDVEWDEDGSSDAEEAGYAGVRGTRLPRPPGWDLAAAVWELDPGATQAPYHFHHGAEELLIVLRGRPTLRTPDGERELEEGEAVHFAKGLAGAHQVSNRSDAPVRYVIASGATSPEVVEYPDSGKVIAMARTESQQGERLFTIHRLADAVEYFEGEPRPGTEP